MSAGQSARSPGDDPQLDAGHGGLGDNGKINIPTCGWNLAAWG